MKGNISSLTLVKGEREQAGMNTFQWAMQLLQGRRRVLLYCLLAFALGFEGAFLLNLVKTMFVGIVGSCLLALLCMYYVRTSLKRTPTRKDTVGQNVVDIASLLNRDVVPLESPDAAFVLKGRVVLVTGAAGSIGSELCRQLLRYEPKRLIALDNNETGLFDLAQSLRLHRHAACLSPTIGDITNVHSMERLFATELPQIVFHAAAYKHVPLLEQHPEQAIRTNTLATYHLCRIAQGAHVQRFVFISTDKAADPTSMLGVSKRIGEKIMQTMAQEAQGETRFCAVRFGNVIGSRGSVVPVFTQQIRQGGPVTVTDPQATRYFMTIPEACGLVILTAALAEPGGLYLLDMGEPVRIVEVALKMISAQGLRVGRDITLVYTGLRPGEKLHETLVAASESLQETMHAKIMRIVCDDNVPSGAVLQQWMGTLERSLHSEDGDALRTRLFQFVQKQEPILAK